MKDVIIVGAGAAGCFAGTVLAEYLPGKNILILEKTRQPLAKVRISGGGRCNVTHGNFDVSTLVECYPRGKEFLRSVLHRFGPSDMIRRLEEKGIAIKIEKDGRAFPQTDSSATIIQGFLSDLAKAGIDISLEKEVVRLIPVSGGIRLVLQNGEELEAKKVLWATGGNARSYTPWALLGHTPVSPVPSLFTFVSEETWLQEAAGSVIPSAGVSFQGMPYVCTGPVLITHVGFSGPAILKLSAFAARDLQEKGYQAVLSLHWAGESKYSSVEEEIFQAKKMFPSKELGITPLFGLSKKLWRIVVNRLLPSSLEKPWARVSLAELHTLAKGIHTTRFSIVGKNTNKEEFVTAGGVDLREIFPKTCESRKVPGLYFAGEVLNVDGITGGFNFQNAWSTAMIASEAIVAALEIESSS